MRYALAPDMPYARAPPDAFIMRLGVEVAFAKGEEIFAQDEQADIIHVVVIGAARTTRLLRDGRRQIGNFYYQGDLIGPETGRLHRFSAEALGACRISVVRRSTFGILSGDSEFDNAIWGAMRSELDRTQARLQVLGRTSARERVAGFLLNLAQRCPSIRVRLPMGRRDMADYLCLTVETVSRMITELQIQQIVEFSGVRHFRVKHRQALERLAG